MQGHIIDSGIMTQLFDKVMDMGGNFEILVFDIGKKKTDPSYARLRIALAIRRNCSQFSPNSTGLAPARLK